MIPHNITARDVMLALAEINRDGIPARRVSRTHDLIHGGKAYPPKYVLSLANRYANGEELVPELFISTESRLFLENLGFDVKPKHVR